MDLIARHKRNGDGGVPLDQPVKPIRIPLRATDEDVVLHLQPLVAQAYERGRYESLDYSQLVQTIHPPFTRDEEAFVEQVLKPSGKQPSP